MNIDRLMRIVQIILLLVIIIVSTYFLPALKDYTEAYNKCQLKDLCQRGLYNSKLCQQFNDTSFTFTLNNTKINISI